MTEKKPARRLELTVDIDAPLEDVWKALTTAEGLRSWFAPLASVSAPGAGAEVTVGWSDEMMMTSKVGTWTPLRHVGWVDESGFMGEGTSIALDFHLSTENGKTRVRLVQSGFGESGGWDDFFAGTEVGWRYFIYNLRVYVERHLGRVRHMISERIEAPLSREAMWRHLLSTTAGFMIAGTGAVKAGDWVQLKLSDPATVRAAVDIAVTGHALALRLTELDDALLFIELEGCSPEKFHVGYWLSVYDEKHAKALEEPARRAFRRIHESLPKG